MFCTHCGVQLGEQQPNFCPTCGQRTQEGAAYARPAQKRLERSISHREVGGVCAGLADYLNLDVTLIRLLAVIGLVFSVGTGALAYIIAMFVIPEEQPRTGEAPVRS
ncbi:MAG: PspC domain-containing protein [Bryobacteraceae bacterium]